MREQGKECIAMFLSKMTFDQLTPELLKKHKNRKLVLFGSLVIGIVLGILGMIFSVSNDEEMASAPIWETILTGVCFALGLGAYGVDLGCGVYYCRGLYKKMFAFIKQATKFILALPVLGWIFVFCMQFLIPLMVVFFVALFFGWIFVLRDVISLIRKRPLIYDSDLTAGV